MMYKLNEKYQKEFRCFVFQVKKYKTIEVNKVTYLPISFFYEFEINGCFKTKN